MNLKNVFSFVSGFAVGGLATYFATKRYYKDIADEEIDSVKAAYRINKKCDPESEIVTKNPDVTYLKEEVTKICTEKGYSNDHESLEDVQVVSADEVSLEHYDLVTVYRYDDGIFLDDDGDVIDNPRELFGSAIESLLRKDISEPIYLKNEKTHCYYEVFSEKETYSQIDSRSDSLEEKE